jgi:hypothetical protein
MLAEAHGTTADLLFADLAGASRPLQPAPLPMLAYWRARLAWQRPILRLDPSWPAPTSTLLLSAAQALVGVADQPDLKAVADIAAVPVSDALERCFPSRPTQRMPCAGRGPGRGLDERQARHATAAESTLDTSRVFMSGVVPIRNMTVASEDGTAILWLDLSARPDIADLLRMLTASPPSDGADTVVTWSMLAGLGDDVAKLDVDGSTWYSPSR